MRFASRQDAGRKLGEYLRFRGVSADLVLGLPRGGVVVAAEVARRLNLPLNVLAVRKIGHPLHREFAIGALAEPGVILFDDESTNHFPVDRAAVDQVVKEELKRLQVQRLRFHPNGMPSVEGKTVLLVDDGLATGATAEAAVASVKARKAVRIIVAAPVASLDAADRLRRVANVVEVLIADEAFGAVGQYYARFGQTTDEEVISLLPDPIARAA